MEIRSKCKLLLKVIIVKTGRVTPANNYIQGKARVIQSITRNNETVQGPKHWQGKTRQKQGKVNMEKHSEVSAYSWTRLCNVSVFVCSLNSYSDWKQWCIQSVPRHGVLWEMESVARSWMECPLEELMCTPAGDRDILKQHSSVLHIEVRKS